MGAFYDVIGEGFDQEEFTNQVNDLFAQILQTGGSIIMLCAPIQDKGPSPVGLIVMSYFEDVGYPHVQWFNWATTRTKIETIVSFIQDIRKHTPILITAKEVDAPFFSHLSRYALVRRVGTIKERFGSEDGFLYQSIKDVHRTSRKN